MLYFCEMRYASALVSIFLFAACTNSTGDNDNGTDSSGSSAPVTPTLNFTVTNSFNHDTSSFTQGLNVVNGKLLESTGNYGHSRIVFADIKTGKIEKQVALDAKFFGEGAVMLHDTIYMLTWKERTVLVYSKDFKKIKELPLNYEGWGLTTNGKELIASDGSSNLYFYEPGTFRLLRTQGVTENGNPIAYLNELEYVNGFIYANQWQTNYIYKIDANSGAVTGKMDLTALYNRALGKYAGIDVLNGIAYDPGSKKLYVTGKLWPEVYELQGNW